MLYVYGIVRAGSPEPRRATGLGSPPARVEILSSGPVAAAVSELADDVVVSEGEARAHLHVLIDLLRDGPVLPLRLGTVEPDADAVRTNVLDANRATFVAQLDALDGLVELQVDVDDDESALLAEIAPRFAPLGAGGDLAESVELGHLVALELVERRREVAGQIVGRLDRLAVRSIARAELRGPEDPVLRWAFLVHQDDLGRFDDAIAALRSEHHTLSFRYVGPLPASHFLTQLQTTESQPADAFRGTGNWGW